MERTVMERTVASFAYLTVQHLCMILVSENSFNKVSFVLSILK